MDSGNTFTAMPANWWQRLTGKGPRARGFVLALGGGGGRGLAHLGVLEALEEQGLRPSAIIGTSIGALFGTMYALEPDARRLQQRIMSFLNSKAFRHLDLPILTEAETADQTWLGKLTAAARESVLYTRAAAGVALTDTRALTDIVRTLCRDRGFDALRIPVYITGVHFPSGEIQLFSKGDLVRAITASMAVPGVFEPVEIDGRTYVDGGVACELPAREARMAARREQVVVAVDVGARPDPARRPTTVFGMLDWAGRVKSLYLRQYKAAWADILIQAVPGFRQWNDFSHPDQEIERGRQVALEHIPALLSRLGS